MNKIRKGDEVIVLTGKDKGKRGTVQAVLGDKVAVEGVNVAKKHARPNPMLGTTGGVVDKVMPCIFPTLRSWMPMASRRASASRWKTVSACAS